jgi:hypothetical protein
VPCNVAIQLRIVTIEPCNVAIQPHTVTIEVFAVDRRRGATAPPYAPSPCRKAGAGATTCEILIRA